MLKRKYDAMIKHNENYVNFVRYIAKPKQISLPFPDTWGFPTNPTQALLWGLRHSK